MLRSRNFFFAMRDGKFADTYITHHPGVTTCWLGSIAIWNRFERDSFSKNWFYSNKFLSPEMLASIRFPITLVTGILVLVAGILLYRLFGWGTAGFGTLFLAVEPFLLAESRRAHTDALTSLFLFLSLLLWLCYLESETPRRRDIIFSGICFAFACLTKSLAGAFLVFLPFLLGWYLKQHSVPWVKLVWSTLLWMMSALITVIVAWPHLWIATFNLWNLPMFPVLFVGSSTLLIWSSRKLSTDTPSALTPTELFLVGYGLFITIGGTLSAVEPVIAKMYGAAAYANLIPILFLGEIRYNPGMLYFPVMWFVWSMPLTLPLMGVAMCRAWQQRNQEKKAFRVVVVLGAFALFYLIGLSFTAKKISRYIVIFLPTVSCLMALGLVQVTHLLQKKRLQALFLVAVTLLQITPILRLHPYYRTYYHPLLSGQWVATNTSSITGAGLDLAADYLNALPNAQHLQVQLSGLFTQDLAQYFVGHTAKRGSTTDPRTDFDYAVEHLYDKQIQGIPVDPPPRDDIQPSMWQPSQKFSRELEHVVRLNGIDYVWIYRILPKEAP
ncbi:MAG: glycosyltransferase family 39 protein [Candidatus Poribacteria bacterium]|nr:glycosyltransferase family 39 protein [Candidatus Poribacteria bacterium]